MKKILSVLLSAVIMLSICTPALAYTAEEKYDNMQTVIDFIKQYGITSSKDDDPLKSGLINAFEKNPAIYDELMDAMLSHYSKYNMFLPESTYNTAFPTSDSYVGVGITLEQRDSHIAITAVTDGGSAKAAGVMPGDILYKAGDMLVSGKGLSDITSVLRGAEGTFVSMTVKRNGKLLTFNLERKYIGIPNFSSKVLEKGIFYMDFTRFADTNTYLQFIFALQDMVKANSRVLILDLRGNPGGDLDMALNVVNRLLPIKTPYFGLASRGADKSKKFQAIESDGIGVALNKIVILADHGSASASEVIQVSLCDLGYAVSVGEQTYGKARGQYHMQFNDGSAAVLTSMELLAPSSPDYDGIGLAPTYPVANKTSPHPAAKCEAVPEISLYPKAWNANSQKLNSALAALGYMSPKPAWDKEFGADTSAALGKFCQSHGLAKSDYLTPYIAREINKTLRAYAGSTIVTDMQLQKAIEVAREFAKLPQQYTVDEFGNFTNNPIK